MRHPVEESPRDGTAILLEDDASGTYDVAPWSTKAGEWVGENGEPSKITPTHWYPRPRDQFLQEDDRPPRRFAVLSSIAALMAVGLMVLYFQIEAPETLLSNQGSHKSEADHAKVKAGAQVKQAVEAPRREARQSLKMGRRSEVSANELAEDQRAIDRLNRQLQLLGEERQNGYAARQELTAGTAQHRQSLDEGARSAALASELAAAQRAIEMQASQFRKASDETAEAAKSAQLIEQEHEKAVARAQEAGATQQQLAAQHRQALDEERARSNALARELATARREIEAQAARLREATDETEQLKQVEAAKSAQLVEQEQQKIAVLAREVAAARQELTESKTQHRQALDDGSARRAALLSDLATAQRELETQAAQRKASDETGQLKQAAAMAELRQSLQQERDKAEALARDLESARRTVGARVTPEPAANNPASKAAQAAEVAALAPVAVIEAQGSPEAPRLIARARALLGQGNVGAARVVLERAADKGSALATFMLAETYDPDVLSAWGTYGTRGEVTRARELYTKAHAGGIQEAKNRFNALR
jgi:hypothetical protein